MKGKKLRKNNLLNDLLKIARCRSLYNDPGKIRKNCTCHRRSRL